MDEEEFSLKGELEALLALAGDVYVNDPQSVEGVLEELRRRLQLLIDVVD